MQPKPPKPAHSPPTVSGDLDPTNNRWGLSSPGIDYVTLAIGRDYADVSPVRGVIHGGASHTLEVAVTVHPASELVI
jgi:transglutaminase-like putative cysteine protease